MRILLKDNDIADIVTIVDNGKRLIGVDLDGKLHVVLKEDVITVSPN